MNKRKQDITVEVWLKAHEMVYKKVKEYCGYPELDAYKVRRLVDASHMFIDHLESLDAFEVYSMDQLNSINLGVDWLIKVDKIERVNKKELERK